MKKARNEKMSICALLILAVIMAGCSVLAYNYCSVQNNTFKITNYSIATDKPIKNLRIAMVADLHLKEYGEGNKDLLDAIAEQGADLIAVVGDSVIYNNNEYDTAIDFLNQAAKIAPTYFSAGNHEWSLIFHYKNNDLLKELQNCDATFLKNEIEETTINDNTLIICGAYDQADARWGFTDNVFTALNSKANDNKFKLVLSHYPMMIQNSNVTPKADLVLSAHEHGGQVIIPIINKGLFSRNQGWFPKHTMGINYIANNLVIISTGLSNSYHWFPRINNQPEFVVIDVNKEDI